MLCLPVCLCTLCAVPTEVGVRSSRTGGVADGGKRPQGFWGTEPGSSGRVGSAPTRLAISPALSLAFLTQSRIILFQKDRQLRH